jgi:hypothetical protein
LEKGGTLSGHGQILGLDGSALMADRQGRDARPLLRSHLTLERSLFYSSAPWTAGVIEEATRGLLGCLNHRGGASGSTILENVPHKY